MKTSTISKPTAECLHDFTSRFPRSQELMEFVQIRPNTEAMWRLHGIMPNGETLLRLQFFLMYRGYCLSEFDGLDKTIWDLSRCIALSVISSEEIKKRFSFPHAKDFYRYVRKENVPGPEKRRIMEQIIGEHAEALAIAHGKMIDSVSTTSTIIATPMPKGAGVGGNNLLAEFSEACEKVLALGKQLLDGPVEQRIEMRKQLGTGREPKLHLTREILTKLLREKTGHES